MPAGGSKICAGSENSSTIVFTRGVMELRNHPFMRRHGIANWPPVWTQAKKQNNKAMRGEFGVLRYVHWYRAGSNKCYLVMEYNKEHYVGALLFDDATFCRQIATILQAHIGEAISDIGTLDLSSTL
jgi:hypothetical protein